MRWCHGTHMPLPSCDAVYDKLAPSFFADNINFEKGAACVFFREVLKVVTEEAQALAKNAKKAKRGQ